MKIEKFENSYGNFTKSFNEIVSIKHNDNIKCIVLEAPTGYGKSWIVIKDMILTVAEFIERKKEGHSQQSKLVVEFVAPQLKLCSQFVYEAKYYINKWIDTYYPHYSEKIKYFINNSGGACFDATGNWNGFNTSASGYSFDDFVESNQGIEIAFVNSCLKSNSKSTKKFKNLNLNDYRIVSYIDEVQNVSLIDHSSDEDEIKIDMNDYADARTNVIAISATVPAQIFVKFEEINRILTKKGCKEYYVTTVTFKQALLKNRVIPPMFHKATTDVYSDSYWTTCIDIHNRRVEEENSKENGISVKTLFTCTCEKDATNVSKLLTKNKISWAKTTSASGMSYYNSKSGQEVTFKKPNETQTNEEADDYMVSDETVENLEDFKKIIQNELGHCVVIHIKQLICGIDIPFLTDAMIRLVGPLKFDKATINIIQTIGRTLRILEDDRLIDYEYNDKRKKPFGHVHIIMPNADTEQNIEIEDSIWKLNDIYYGGFGRCDFKTQSRKLPGGSSDTESHEETINDKTETSVYDIDWTKMNFEDYVKEVVKSQIGLLYKEEIKYALPSILDYVKTVVGISELTPDNFLYHHISWDDIQKRIVEEFEEQDLIIQY